MSGTDAGFYYAEGENTPMHVGSVAVFEGPAPSYGDVVRLLLGKLSEVPRYRQRPVRMPMNLGRPLWVDDPHFQILYHIRHTAVPKPGSEEQVRNLAGRVLGQRLDLSKPLWELWLVEGLADGRWAMINKVHHAMVDGVAGTDLMQLIFDLTPDARQPEPKAWVPRRPPSAASMVFETVADAVAWPMRQALAAPSAIAGLRSPQNLLRRGGVLGGAMLAAGRQMLTPVAPTLNGAIGPHRRWAWTQTTVEDVRRVRKAFGGSMNDVVLAAITGGFRDLLAARGQLAPGRVVRTMVPVSIRRQAERGALNNQVSAVFVDLPVSEPKAKARLDSVRAQMDAHKRTLSAYDPRSVPGLVDLVPAGLLAAGVRTLLRADQPWLQAITTNVPGPPVPLYVLGRRMESLYAYVPIGGGVRTSIGIFSYRDTISFGINVDFDAVPEVDVLADGICRGMEDLVKAAERADAVADGSGSPNRQRPVRKTRSGPPRTRSSAPLNSSKPTR
ncbi:WS/DGAT/MGAT family O-acyltransferase [Cryptosporangium minutisporangium]